MFKRLKVAGIGLDTIKEMDMAHFEQTTRGLPIGLENAICQTVQALPSKKERAATEFLQLTEELE